MKTLAFIESQVDVPDCKILLQHVGKMCYGNVLGNVRNMDEWKECMVDYLDVLFEDILSSLSLSSSIIIPKTHTKIPRISSILSSEYPER